MRKNIDELSEGLSDKSRKQFLRMVRANEKKTIFSKAAYFFMRVQLKISVKIELLKNRILRRKLRILKQKRKEKENCKKRKHQ